MIFQLYLDTYFIKLILLKVNGLLYYIVYIKHNLESAHWLKVEI